jgi:hypothetical protein
MIKHKAKNCKGTGKAKGNGCGETHFRRKYGLCLPCYAKWLLNTTEGAETLRKHTIKVTEPRQRLKDELKKEKDRTKLQYLIQSTVNWCHKYIRLRDEGKECVSCGQPWNKNHQAGHLKKAELYSTLKFDENNIHNQCMGCNLMKDGNVQLYNDRILKRITQAQKDEIERKCIEERQNSFKWQRDDLEQVREYYKKKYNKLKK